jgi:hypothetical protein
MRSVEGIAGVAALAVLGCAPAVQHLGGTTYRLNCDDGIAVCRQTANRVCALGYDIVESSTASSGAGSMLVTCVSPKKPKPVAPLPVELAETPSCPPAMPEGVECVRNFQCSGEGARCIDGRCVTPTTVSWFEAPSTPGDGGAPAPAPARPDGGP